MLTSSGMRGGKFIPVDNFSAQCLATSRNRHILNFRVTVVPDLKLSRCFSKNKYLSRDFEQKLK